MFQKTPLHARPMILQSLDTILPSLIDHLPQLVLLGEFSAQSIEITDRVSTGLEKRFLG